MDTAGDVYMIMTIDAANDGSGGYLQLDMDATGGIGMTFDPVKFMGPPHDHLLNGDSTDSRDGYTAQTATMEHPYQSSWALYQNASLSFGWDACCNDGMIFGPFPRTQWSLNMKVVTQETRGIEDIRVGTYDSDKNDVGYLSIPIKRATATYGGIQLDGMDCTDYCQRYQDCSECGRQESCQFAPQNGGCVSAAAYVYDFGCPRPQFRPLTKLLTRNDAAFLRERDIDDYDSAALLRVAMDRVDMSCPCDSLYRISVAVYNAAMSPIQALEDIHPRLDHRHTFVDIPNLVNNTHYYLHTTICIKQGTLGRDDCSPVQIDELHHLLPANAYPPPTPPPFPPSPPVFPAVSSS